jgi:peptide/nickel transport system substrate-binding protein
MTDSAAQVAAIRGERAMIQFRGFSPAERDSLVNALGNKITVQESPWNCVILVAMNHEDRDREGSRWRPGPGHAVRHTAGRAREAGGLRS